MRLTEYELNGYAHFTGDSSFELNAVPDWVQPIEEPATRPHPTDLATNGTHELMPAIPLGLYELPRRSGNAHFYRMVHPLAQNVLQKAKLRTPDLAQLTFDYTNAENKITQLESLTRPAGWLKLSQLTVDSPAQSEDTIIWAGVTDDGQPLETDLLSRLFTLPAEVGTVTEQEPAILQDKTDEAREKQLADISKRNAIFFEDEINKLEAWADDRKIGLEREIKDYDRRIKEARRLALAAQTLEEKLAAQKEVKALEKERNNRRRTLFEAQDQIDDQRDKIIEETEAQLQQTVSITELFTIRWHII